jgi:hypothetical protein
MTNPETPSPWVRDPDESRADYAARIAPEADAIAKALADAPMRCWKRNCKTRPKYLACFDYPYRFAWPSCKQHSKRAWPKSRPRVWASQVFNIKRDLSTGEQIAGLLVHYSEVFAEYNPMLGIERYLKRVAEVAR